MPSATPPMMMMVAGLGHGLIARCVRAYSSLVENSVHLPISQPATRLHDHAAADAHEARHHQPMRPISNGCGSVPGSRMPSSEVTNQMATSSSGPIARAAGMLRPRPESSAPGRPRAVLQVRIVPHRGGGVLAGCHGLSAGHCRLPVSATAWLGSAAGRPVSGRRNGSRTRPWLSGLYRRTLRASCSRSMVSCWMPMVSSVNPGTLLDPSDSAITFASSGVTF